MKSYKTLSAFVGILIGLGAPLGSLIVRALISTPFDAEWIRQEISSHSFYYAYMSLVTPVVLAVFGFTMGYFMDKFFSQKSSLENINSLLKEQSIMDDLTGQYNRRHILVQIEKEIERARRYGHTLSGMMIDVDDFKKFNDKYGHLVGDYVLKEVAFLFELSIRKIDVLGRFGGDEFLIILPESTMATALIVAQRIKKSITEHRFTMKDHTLHVTVSIGLFSFRSLADIDKTTFVEKVDNTLLRAKKLGKNQIYHEQ